MNILYLRYAVEVARYGSINKAAESLYVAQPNVSRAIKELETSLGISIFERSPKGMVLTEDGERLIRYGKGILSQIDEVEHIFREGKNRKKKFSISVPRASYISRAFVEFSKKLPPEEAAEYVYKETNALRAISNILNSDYRLGIIRYARKYSKAFDEMLEEKGLSSELITEFAPVVLMSKEHPLAEKNDITPQDLRPFVEVANPDPYVPTVRMSDVKKEELSCETDRKIFVFERASQFEILSENRETFMRVSAVPQFLCEKYELVQKKISGEEKIYRDVLIYKKNYRLNALDKQFITELCEAKREVFI